MRVETSYLYAPTAAFSPLSNAHHRLSSSILVHHKIVTPTLNNYEGTSFRDVSTRVNSAPPAIADCCLIYHHLPPPIHPFLLNLSLSLPSIKPCLPPTKSSSNKPSQTRPYYYLFYLLFILSSSPRAAISPIRSSFCFSSKRSNKSPTPPSLVPATHPRPFVLREDALYPACWFSACLGSRVKRLIVRSFLSPCLLLYIPAGVACNGIKLSTIPLTNERVAESLFLFGVLLGPPVFSGRFRGCDGGDSFSPVHACLLGSSNVKPVHPSRFVPVKWSAVHSPPRVKRSPSIIHPLRERLG